jgi:putative peptide zinc metalloprotease protein
MNTNRMSTSHIGHRIAALAVAIALAFGAIAPPAALATGDTSAVAVNTRDDSTFYSLMLSIRRVMGDTVDTSNAAVAVSRCDACESVAVAIQVVLAAEEPTVVVPENLALAMNIDCNLCQSLADAYQYVLTGTGVVRFTAQGNRQIAEIRRSLELLRTQDLPLDDLQARIEELNGQLTQVLATELVPAGPPPAETEAGTETTSTNAEPADTGTETTPTGTSTTPTETETTPTETSTTPTETETTPTETSTTPTETETTPTDTSTTPTETETTPTDTSTTTSG